MTVLFEYYYIFGVALAALAYRSVRGHPAMGDAMLITLSLGLLACIHPVFSVVMVALSVACWCGVRRGEHTRARVVVALGTLALCLLSVGKYLPGLWESWVGHRAGWSEFIMVPLGISYFVPRVIHYLIDTWRGLISAHPLRHALLYFSFFPVLPAGPMECFSSFYSKRSFELSSDQYLVGVRRIIIGYFKKLFLVELVLDGVFGDWVHAHSVMGAGPLWYGTFMVVRVYLDLSAYSDIAIGTSALFGFRIMENFKMPFLSPNLLEFWRRWHISLSEWCRRNIYFPVVGVTRSPVIALYTSMIVMGLWHVFSPAWFLWGVYHATGLVIVYYWGKFCASRLFLMKITRSWAFRVVSPAVTLIYFGLGFCLVKGPTAMDGVRFVLSIFRLSDMGLV